MRLSLSPPILLSLLGLSATTTLSSAETTPSSTTTNPPPPFIEGRTFIDGIVTTNLPTTTPLKDVYGCCTTTTTQQSPPASSTCTADHHHHLSPTRIGTLPQFTQQQSLSVLSSAQRAWKGGMGRWPQMSLRDRVSRVERFIEELKKAREEIVTVLMWEIGKSRGDAESEFDRTVEFVLQTIDAIRNPFNSEFNSEWDSIGSTRAMTRRAAIGIIMCLGPFNYPLNETYATLIPALLMGNIVIMKIPTVGGLVHLLTMEAFAKALPAGTIHLISGGGRATMPPLMETGAIDGLAFIGGSKAADDLIKKHPHPHRLKLFLQLEAKNMGIFLPSVFSSPSTLTHSLKQATIGSLSYNGQRCTALKLLFVPQTHISTFLPPFISSIESLTVGLPWDDNVAITPLPNTQRISYMKELLNDATSKGAKIVNARGGEIVGGANSTLMIPAVLFPVTSDMRVYHEEQFGPIVPIVAYDSLEDEVLAYAREGSYGQQVSLFTSPSDDDASLLLDKFSSIFGKININSQCGRSPDTLPFSGRRSSAMGVMSVLDALREFSVPTVVAYKNDGSSGAAEVVKEMEGVSTFLESL